LVNNFDTIGRHFFVLRVEQVTVDVQRVHVTARLSRNASSG
jgi:hypothetical protein